MKEKGRRALIVTGDVVDGASLTAAVAKTEQALGPLTLAVNCAGIANAAPAEDMPFEQWKRMMDVNLTGVFLSCQAEGRAMLGAEARRDRQYRLDVRIDRQSRADPGPLQRLQGRASSISARAWRWNGSAAACGSTSSAPATRLTPMNKRPEVAEQLKVFAAETPMARIAAVEEMVGPAIFLLSPAASFMTGVDLLVDGGFECW